MKKKVTDDLGNLLAEIIFSSSMFQKYLKLRHGTAPALVAGLKPRRLKNTHVGAAELRNDIVARLRVVRNGMSVSQIAKATGSSLEAARYALKLLRGAGKVRMTGKRATAKWFVRK